MKQKRSVSMRLAVILLAVVLLIGCAAGGTLAYLMLKTDTVTNTFVIGEIGTLTLKETTGNSYNIVPGVDVTKDPQVTFSGNNIPAYVFVKIDAAAGWTANAGTYKDATDNVSWTVDAGWTALSGVPGVYYREAEADNSGAWSVISGNTITVSSKLTDGELDGVDLGLSFTAYAIQSQGFADAAAAWAEASQ